VENKLIWEMYHGCWRRLNVVRMKRESWMSIATCVLGAMADATRLSRLSSRHRSSGFKGTRADDMPPNDMTRRPSPHTAFPSSHIPFCELDIYEHSKHVRVT
jgi:hypothetical protein